MLDKPQPSLPTDYTKLCPNLPELKFKLTEKQFKQEFLGLQSLYNDCKLTHNNLIDALDKRGIK